MNSRIWDAVIIGGGPAGMSGALILGRSRKRVLVLDQEEPRHAVALGVHNFLTREGISPSELRRIGGEQIAQFPTVTFQHAQVIQIDRQGEGPLTLLTDQGESIVTRSLLLATGVRDLHPDIAGFQDHWGQDINVCPYCHGWEARDQPIAVVVSGEHAAIKALLLRGWSDDVMLFTQGGALNDAHAAALRDAKIPIEAGFIVGFEGAPGRLTGLRLGDGRFVERSSVFIELAQEPLPVVAALNLPMLDGAFIAIDGTQRTEDPRIWAAGDCTTRMQTVAGAVAAGTVAGAVINHSLTVPNF